MQHQLHPPRRPRRIPILRSTARRTQAPGGSPRSTASEKGSEPWKAPDIADRKRRPVPAKSEHSAGGMGNPTARRFDCGERNDRKKAPENPLTRAHRGPVGRRGESRRPDGRWACDGRRFPGRERGVTTACVLGLRVRQGVPVGYGIDGRVIPGRRSASGCDHRQIAEFSLRRWSGAE